MPFSTTGVLFGLSLIGAAGLALWQLPKRKELWRKIPRERYFGSILGLVCLYWSSRLAMPLLEGGLSSIAKMLPVIVVVIAVASFLLLDYVFSRALGGFLLLVVNYLLHQAFVVHAGSALFSVVCYLVGIAGLFMIGSPYHFRDVLDKMTNNSRWRFGVCGFLFFSGAVSCTVAAMSHGS